MAIAPRGVINLLHMGNKFVTLVVVEELTAKDLADWMEKNGWSATDVASVLGIHANTVNNFLSGKSGGIPTIRREFARLIEKPRKPPRIAMAI